MKNRISVFIKIIVLVFLILTVSGCMISVDELYGLPQMTEDYVQLQEKIDKLLSSGMQYSAPIAGSYRQSVQLQDIDGDNTEEALAFFEIAGDDNPLKIYIFELENNKYTEVGKIEGAGTNIESIYYSDLNGDGGLEIIVGWQMSTDLKLLSIYSVQDNQISQIMNVDYSSYTMFDLSGDGNDDVIVLRMSSSELSGEVQMYSLMSDGEVVNTTAKLSLDVESVSRVRTGYISGMRPALIVESVYGGNGVITDIFSCLNHNIINITVDPTTETSEETIRTYNVYSVDINGDGVMEIPHPVLLQEQSDTTTSYWKIEWYSYRLTGVSHRVMTTYHNYSDGWYLVLPDDWRDKITIRRADDVSGERAVVFSLIDEQTGNIKDFLIIYTLSGDNKAERSRQGDRFVLRSEGEKIYAAEILVDPDNFGLTLNESVLTANFKIIYSEWITGEI